MAAKLLMPLMKLSTWKCGSGREFRSPLCVVQLTLRCRVSLGHMGRNSQILWIEGRQATSDTGVSGDGSGVMSTGRSRSLPWWNTAPARTNATRCGALTARHRDCAASISL